MRVDYASRYLCSRWIADFGVWATPIFPWVSPMVTKSKPPEKSHWRQANDLIKLIKPLLTKGFSLHTTANRACSDLSEAESRCWGFYKFFLNLKKGRQTLTEAFSPVSGLAKDVLISAFVK